MRKRAHARREERVGDDARFVSRGVWLTWKPVEESSDGTTTLWRGVAVTGAIELAADVYDAEVAPKRWKWELYVSTMHDNATVERGDGATAADAQAKAEEAAERHVRALFEALGMVIARACPATAHG